MQRGIRIAQDLRQIGKQLQCVCRALAHHCCRLVSDIWNLCDGTIGKMLHG